MLPRLGHHSCHSHFLHFASIHTGGTPICPAAPSLEAQWISFTAFERCLMHRFASALGLIKYELMKKVLKTEKASQQKAKEHKAAQHPSSFPMARLICSAGRCSPVTELSRPSVCLPSKGKPLKYPMEENLMAKGD